MYTRNTNRVYTRCVARIKPAAVVADFVYLTSPGPTEDQVERKSKDSTTSAYTTHFTEKFYAYCAQGVTAGKAPRRPGVYTPL